MNINSLVWLAIFFSVSSCTPSIKLFNGQDLSGWHSDVPEIDNASDVKNPFIVRNGVLVSLGAPVGHLITNEVFKNYRLKLRYRFAGKPSSCGVLVHASTPRALYKMFPQSIEVQMMRENAGDFWCIAEDITVLMIISFAHWGCAWVDFAGFGI